MTKSIYDVEITSILIRKTSTDKCYLPISAKSVQSKFKTIEPLCPYPDIPNYKENGSCAVQIFKNLTITDPITHKTWDVVSWRRWKVKRGC